MKLTTPADDQLAQMSRKLDRIEELMTQALGHHTRRLSVKELSASLGRSERYVRAMKRDGFSMPGGLATLNEAKNWLEDHPDFRVNP